MIFLNSLVPSNEWLVYSRDIAFVGATLLAVNFHTGFIFLKRYIFALLWLPLVDENSPGPHYSNALAMDNTIGNCG